MNSEERYPWLISKKKISKNLLLLIARCGFSRLLQYFLDRLNAWYTQILVESIKYGNLESVQVLLDKGANINAYDGVVMTTAINSEQLEIVKYLVQKGFNLQTYKFPYLTINNLELFKYLSSQGLIFNRDMLNNFIALGSNPQMIRYLLKRYSWSSDMLDSLLFTVFVKGDLEISKILMENGAKISQDYLGNPELKDFLDDHLESWV